MQAYDLAVYSEHDQFYLQDDRAVDNFANVWTKEAGDRLLAVAPGFVWVGTISSTVVAVRIEILESEPADDADKFDHVTECTLSVTSGLVVVAGCTDDFTAARRIDLPRGTYRVRASYADLDSLSCDCYITNESYRVQLWLAPAIATRVLKWCRASLESVCRDGGTCH